jgi:hypothetical protein
MGAHISVVKSLHLDVECWKGELLKFMCSNGNEKANSIYEAKVPIGFIRPHEFPTRDDVRENWIRAKWERHEFLAGTEAKADEIDGFKQGFLVKSSGKDHTKSWQRRWFVLSGICLTYYKKPTDDESKGVISLKDAKIDLYHGDEDDKDFVFTIGTKGGDNRVYQIKASSDRELFDWIHAIRGAVMKHQNKIGTPLVSKALPDLEALELFIKTTSPTLLLNNTPLHKGPLQGREVFMFSTKWSWHWATLLNGCLIITKTDVDKAVLQVIVLENCHVEVVAMAEIHKDYAFVIRCFNQQFFFAVDNNDALNEWVRKINQAKLLAAPKPK